jgi:hypothetical protein
VPAPGLLAVRFLCGLFALAVGAPLVQDLLQRRALFAADAAGRIEASMVAWVIACAGVAAFARWQPPGLPLRPLRLLPTCGPLPPRARRRRRNRSCATSPTPTSPGR